MTVKSMTAFARAAGEAPACHWSWEVKSVNSKGLDIRFRMPPGFDAIDIAVRERTAKRLSRGNLFIALTLKWREDAAEVRINEGLLEKLSGLAPTLKSAFPDASGLSLDGVLGLKGVVEVIDAGENDGVREGLSEPLLASFDEALDNLVSMREEEGARMADVLLGQIDEIETLQGQAASSAETQPEAIKARMTAQIAEVLSGEANVTEDRMAQEIALLVTKADIREELDRLNAHIAAARNLLGQNVPIGRKLDFLCQEFNREVNTICSKAQDVKLTGIGLDLKAVIEQFREQVQNIE